MLYINDEQVEIPDELSNTPLVQFLRDYLDLTGTKFGCGKGLCGACTVHVNGSAARSCQLILKDLTAARITTIEGLKNPDRTDALHPVQDAWIKEAVPQCGYCQPGQIMSATALLIVNPKPTDAEISEAMSGNLCRCGTYPRIRKAIHTAAGGQLHDK
ncbi:MAG: (2Fe-2S)-binding protein [Sneathiella sp.]